VVLYEMGDTVTENALLAAAKTDGWTEIHMASANYMVQDLCRYLEALGVKIEGIGTSRLRVKGRAIINKNISFSPSEDPIETMLFISLAVTTNSAITIKRCPIDFLELELLKLKKMGTRFELSQRYKADNGFTDLVDIKMLKTDELSALDEKIHPQPYPGLNIDNLPFFVPISARAQGKTLVHDWVYENRAIYFTELNKLGASIELLDPHRVYINGPTRWRAAEVVCPPALRPAVIVLIGMLAAEGTSVLRNIYSIARGYEDLAERLNSLGAKIEILRDI
jgi:UDP-N-acetylglucosamine 1-carboxyvinyltransferase